MMSKSVTRRDEKHNKPNTKKKKYQSNQRIGAQDLKTISKQLKELIPG